MPHDDVITLFHAPQSRSTGVCILLEELGARYQLHPVNLKAGEQRQPAYLAVNPMGKVPAIRHRDALVTEQVAIYLYLADLFPEAGLAPKLGDPARGSYLRWMVFYAACYEPALVDKAMKREPGPLPMSPYGSFDTMIETVLAPLATHPYLLGDRFSAADLLWGTAFRWGTLFGLLPAKPLIADYVARVTGRPAAAKVAAADATLAAELEAAAKTASA
jgi:glutathione S-transferase